jgi:hypothetical protein
MARLLFPSHGAVLDSREQIEESTLESYPKASVLRAWLSRRTLVTWCQVSFPSLVTALANSLAGILSVKGKRKIIRDEIPEASPKREISSGFRLLRTDADLEPSIRPAADASSFNSHAQKYHWLDAAGHSPALLPCWNYD